MPGQSLRSKSILVQKIKKGEDYIYICYKCTDIISIENMSEECNMSKFMEDYCLHCKVASFVFGDVVTNDVTLDPAKDHIHVANQEPIMVAIVYPKKTLNKPP